jgi:DNA-binding PadR family transcriptional regulator
MSRSRETRPAAGPSDLAAFVLGLVWQHGPCSAYEIRRFLLDSPSAQWSGSAGAIYPLVRRLERDGLLRGAQIRGDRRGRREVTITALGSAALRAWIGPPLGPGVVTVTADPLRSRARFLGALTPKRRAAWIAAAKTALEEVLAAVDRWDAIYGAASDPHLRFLTTHAKLETAARRAWLDDLARSAVN